MSVQVVRLPYHKGGEPLCVEVPSGWKVDTVCRTGARMSKAAVRHAIDHPVGSPPLARIAQNVKTAAIILEDHTRFTPLVAAVDIVLEELTRAGVECILMIGASATHRTTTRSDIAKKISPDALSRVTVIEHVLLDESELVLVGTTSRGTPVRINRRVAQSDLIIGMGGIAPHGSVGFGGGAKLLLPGVAGYETIRHNHVNIDASVGFHSGAVRPMRQDMEEAARMVKYRFNVSGLVDHLGNLVELVAGDPVEAHRTGVKKAKELYYFLVGEKADVVFACSNPLDVDCFQSIKGLLPSASFVRKGGVIFWVSACPEGIGTHQLTQLDADYNANMKKAQQEICRRHKVLFYSDALDSGEIRRYLADEIQFFNNPDRAAEALALAAGPEAVAKILYAAPFTVGV